MCGYTKSNSYLYTFNSIPQGRSCILTLQMAGCGDKCLHALLHLLDGFHGAYRNGIVLVGSHLFLVLRIPFPLVGKPLFSVCIVVSPVSLSLILCLCHSVNHSVAQKRLS